MYCKKCGTRLENDAVFCSACGTKICDEVNKVTDQTRKTIYVGEIKKCPVCGEVLKSTDVECPSCGAEISGRKTSESVKDFVNKVILMEDVNKKVEAIKMYPIPNTKEDINEFMILAVMNCNAKEYAFGKDPNSLSSAWHLKIEQCYKKAKMLFHNPVDFQIIEDQYNQINNKISSLRKKSKTMLLAGIIAIVVGVLLTILPMVGVAVISALNGTEPNEVAAAIATVFEYIGVGAILPVGILLIVLNKKIVR